MEVKREDLNPCTIKLDIVCDPEQVNQGYDKAFKEAAKSMRIPGFRPGHAPRALVEQRIGKEELSDIAIDYIIKDAYKKASEEESIKPYSTGSVQLQELDPENNS